MRLLTLGMCLVIIAVSNASFASFLPPNNLYLYDRVFAFDGGIQMTEKQFNDTIDGVARKLESSVALHGGQLNIVRDWTNSQVNAFSDQQGSTWTVHLFGGLARRLEVTTDGFTLVICHEFGHHLGGFPFYSFLGDWAAAEGQADYFATQVCARRIWGNDAALNALFRNSVSTFVQSKCDSAWTTVSQQNLCYRTAAASQELGNLLSVLESQQIDIQSPDTSIVRKTLESYPSGQCREDTYLNGSLCSANFNLSIIPGRNPNGDQSSLASERQAAANSCTNNSGTKSGARPSCWYRARL